MNTLSITVDIEDWYHIPSVTGSPFAVYKDVDEFFKGWTGKYNYLTEPTKRVLDMLDEYEVTATFFVVADVVEHYPGLVESIVYVNSLYNKTDSSMEWVSSYPYYPKKKGLVVGEEKKNLRNSHGRIGMFLDLILILKSLHLAVRC